MYEDETDGIPLRLHPWRFDFIRVGIMDRILRNLLDSEEISEAERKRLFKTVALMEASGARKADDSAQSAPAETKRQPPKPPKKPRKARGQWIPPDQAITIQDITIPGGMIYVGEVLKSPGGGDEPALIDPTLPITGPEPSHYGYGYGYGWNSYQHDYAHRTPKQRSEYLAWLAGGRRDKPTDHVNVLLFLFGLERRVLVDILKDSSLAPELPAIRDEARALRVEYGSMWGVGDNISKLLDLIDTVALGFGADVPFVFEHRSSYHTAPLALERHLAIAARTERPLPWEMALAWAVYRPRHYMHYLLPHFEDCPDEFSRLFEMRYPQLIPAGVRPRLGKSVRKLSYRRMSDTYYGRPHLVAEIQDVFAKSGQFKRLSEAYQAVAKEIAPYAKAVTGLRTNVSKLAAFGSLPSDLIPGYSPETDSARAVAQEGLGNRAMGSVPGSAFIDIWPVTTPGKMTIPQARNLAIVLAVFGFGIEPDPDFMGPAPVANEPVILFRGPIGSPEMFDHQYRQAQIISQLAVAVAQAGGPVSDEQADAIADRAGAAFGVQPEVSLRLRAYTRWINRKPVKLLQSLNQRLRACGLAEYESTGEQLVNIVAAVRQMSPKTITTLEKAYRLIEIEPELVTSHLHAFYTRAATLAARDPVLVRRGTEQDATFVLPPRPAETGTRRRGAPAPELVLDPDSISAKLEQSQQISAILAGLFIEDEAPIPEHGAVPASEATIGPLDPAHSRLFRAIAARDVWPRVEFDALAAQFRLLPDGAIDTLNEAAFEAIGEPLLEGDEMLAINADAVKELDS